MKSYYKNISKLLFTATILSVFLSSCEKDVSIYGEGLIAGDLFTTDKAVFDVRVDVSKIEAVQANDMSLYQLGNYTDPVYGKTHAEIVSKLQLSSRNPVFGIRQQSDEGTAISTQENERTSEAILYIPFVLNEDIDSDFDGLADAFDIDPDDPESDTDGDGLTDIEEYNKGTNPLSADTDGDGITDDKDTEFIGSSYAKSFELDSIYGNIETPIHVTVKKLDYYLRDLDPSDNFLSRQKYYSTQSFDPEFTSDVIFDGEVTISEKEFLYFKEDDPDTEDIDESEEIDFRQAPGLRLSLNPKFFDRYLLGQEGSENLVSQSNFENFLRGLHISLDDNDDLMMLLDLSKASIRVNYTYETINSDDETVINNSNVILNLFTTSSSGARIGTAVNTMRNDPYPAKIASEIASGENPSRIYLKGGAGSKATLRLFDDTNPDAIIDEIRKNNWIINEARLVFYVDQNQLNGYDLDQEPPRLYLYNERNRANIINFSKEAYDDDSSWGVFTNFDGRLQKKSGKGYKYTVRITDHINNIIVRDSLNDPLALTVSSDVRYHDFSIAKILGNEEQIHKSAIDTPLGTVLFGNNVQESEASKKLQLELYYTISN